jgi:hypothetical protein
MLGVVVLLGSCGTKKRLVNESQERFDLKNITDARLVKLTQEKNIVWESVFFKKFEADVEFDNERKSFKGNMYIVKDSTIVLSVLGLGIELFRIKFEKDGIYILNKTKKEIIETGYQYLWDNFYVDINYSMLERILLNQFFCYPVPEKGATSCIKKYKHYTGDNEYILKSIKDGKYSRLERKNNYSDLIFHSFHIHPELFKIKRAYVSDFNFNSEIDIRYTNFMDVKSFTFPADIAISGKRGSNRFLIKIGYDSIDIDSKSRLSFKYSDKYKRIVR